MLTLGLENESDIPSSSIFAAYVNERNRYAEACGKWAHFPNGAPWLIPYLFSHHGRCDQRTLLPICCFALHVLQLLKYAYSTHP